MRLFVAAAIDPQVSEAIAGCVSQLRMRAETLAPRARITWVHPDRIHITIRFIGETDERRADELAGVLSERIPIAPFAITVQGLGTFPPRGAPRVLWTGIGDGAESVVRLERDVSAKLESRGVEAERRPYQPHLTLARVREAAGLNSGAWLREAGQPRFGVSHVDAITLFHSRLLPGGPEHIAWKTFSLSSSAT